MSSQSDIKKAYKQNPLPMGVYQIKNLQNGKVLIGSSRHVLGILNRHKFELKLGSHRNKELQRDWKQFGEENFTFEVVEHLEPKPDPAYDYAAELAELEALWLEKAQPYGEKGYNRRVEK